MVGERCRLGLRPSSRLDGLLIFDFGSKKVVVSSAGGAPAENPAAARAGFER